MSSYNRVILMGNLTRDPQLRYLPNQTPVVDIGLAVSSKYRTASGEDREEVLFIDCTAFGKQAEVISKYFQKGRPILVDGRLKLDTWDDKTTGQKRSKHKVTIDNFSFVGNRQDGGGGSGGGGQGEGGYDEGGGSMPSPAPQQRAPMRSGPPGARPPQQRQQQPDPIQEETQIPPDDIPF